jgi:hypothetical protein
MPGSAPRCWMKPSMPDQEAQLPWTRPGWFEQASAWIHAELEHQDIRVSGPIEQPHVRPWSTVLRVPTAEGNLYFKATSPVLAHEPALTQALSRWQPDCMPQVMATDLTQLRDIYLEPWARYASRENLLAAFNLAQRVAMVNRALTWRRVVSDLPESFKEQYAEPVPGWLQDFLNAETVASS